MVYNNLIPKIEIDPETYVVKVDGKVATTEAAQKAITITTLQSILGFQIIDQNNNTYIFCKYTLIYESRPHGKRSRISG